MCVVLLTPCTAPHALSIGATVRRGRQQPPALPRILSLTPAAPVGPSSCCYVRNAFVHASIHKPRSSCLDRTVFPTDSLTDCGESGTVELIRLSLCSLRGPCGRPGGD